MSGWRRGAHGPLVLSLAVACALLVGMTRTALAIDADPVMGEAHCAIVTDCAGNVLWSLNPDQEMSMASITKVMTAIVALDSNMSLDTVCTITQSDLGAYSQTAGFATSDTPTLDDLLKAMLVYSGNDAALNVAINVAGSEDAFVARMNEKARELGLTHTHFANPHGLEEGGHHSSAADLARLGRYALENYPFIASTVRLRSVTLPIDGVRTTLRSTDELMGSYAGLIGIKTGAVAAGTAFLGAAELDGIRLYTCVLGCKTISGRFVDTERLLDWAYSNFVQRQVADASWVIDTRIFSDNFALSLVTRATGATTASVWPDGGDLSYTTSMTRHGILANDGERVGATTWVQGGRTAGTVTYEARLSFDKVPAVPVLTLPLYVDTQTLGMTA